MASFKNKVSMNNVEEVEMKPIVVDSAERAAEVEFLKKASSDELKQMFRDYRDGDRASKIGMTDEEANRISDCMGKAEFMDLFRDYVDDISDPKNQEEYDQYLRQLEEEGEIPKDEEIVRPTPGFVVKTKSIDIQSKIFVNICGTPKVPKPTQGARPRGENLETTGSKGDGAANGQFWSIPYIHTSMRMDQDKDRNPCHVYDILFNDDTIKLCEQKDLRFKMLVIQTALESVEENGKVKLKNPETGKFDFNIMTKMTYKGQVVRPHKLKKDTLQQPMAPSHPKNKDKEEKEESKSKPPPKRKVAEEDPTKPKMTVIHRGEINLSDYMNALGGRDLPISRRPKELVIKLELPLMKSAADMELDIKGGFLEFKAKDAGYKLRHKLPYPVNEDTGDAKYVKAQKLLTVTLEVLPWSKEEMDAEIARAEAALAAAAAETRRKQEEEERAAAEDAKRVVKKGFLDKRADKTIASALADMKLSDSKPDATGKASTKVAIEEEEDDDEAAGREGGAAGGGRKLEEVEVCRQKIVDMGECVAGGGGGGAAAGGGCHALGAEGVVGEESGGEPFVSFRQNQKSVTAVVRVADIEEASVAVEITRTRVHMRFSALADASDAGGAGACKGVSKRRVNYAHTLHLSADVDPMQSRYDVSSSNLVLVLRKAEDTRWPTFTGAPRDCAPDAASGCGTNTASAYDVAQEAPGSAAAAAAAAAEVAAAGASAARAEESDAADGKQEQKRGVRFGGEVGPTGGGGGGRGGGGGASGTSEGAGCVCCAAAEEAGLGLAASREAETTASKEASKEASKAEARRVVGANGEVFESGDSFAGSKAGMVFKMGSLGLGYYTDKPLHTQIRHAGKEEEEEEAERGGTKLAPEPVPKTAAPAAVGEQWGDRPMPKLPFSNTLIYDLD